MQQGFLFPVTAIVFPDIVLQPPDRERSLLSSQPLGRAREVGEDEEGGNCHGYGDGAFDDEEPAPCT